MNQYQHQRCPLIMPRILLHVCGNLLFPLYNFFKLLHTVKLPNHRHSPHSAHNRRLHVILYRNKIEAIIWKLPKLSITKSVNLPNVYPSCSSPLPSLLFLLPFKVHSNLHILNPILSQPSQKPDILYHH